MASRINPIAHKIAVQNNWPSVGYYQQREAAKFTYEDNIIRTIVSGVLRGYRFFNSEVIIKRVGEETIIKVVTLKISKRKRVLKARRVKYKSKTGRKKVKSKYIAGLLEHLIGSRIGKNVKVQIIRRKRMLKNAEFIADYIENRIKTNFFGTDFFIKTLFQKYEKSLINTFLNKPRKSRRRKKRKLFRFWFGELTKFKRKRWQIRERGFRFWKKRFLKKKRKKIVKKMLRRYKLNPSIYRQRLINITNNKHYLTKYVCLKGKLLIPENRISNYIAYHKTFFK